jgi:K+-transporting ATPase A subunit
MIRSDGPEAEPLIAAAPRQTHKAQAGYFFLATFFLAALTGLAVLAAGLRFLPPKTFSQPEANFWFDPLCRTVMVILP